MLEGCAVFKISFLKQTNKIKQRNGLDSVFICSNVSYICQNLRPTFLAAVEKACKILRPSSISWATHVILWFLQISRRVGASESHSPTNWASDLSLPGSRPSDPPIPPGWLIVQVSVEKSFQWVGQGAQHSCQAVCCNQGWLICVCIWLDASYLRALLYQVHSCHLDLWKLMVTGKYM